MSNIPQIKLSTPNPPTMRLNNVPNVADERSRIWAEGTDEEVEALGGEHSAKNWVKENCIPPKELFCLLTMLLQVQEKNCQILIWY